MTSDYEHPQSYVPIAESRSSGPDATVDCPVHGLADAVRWYAGAVDGKQWKTPPICARCYVEATVETTRAYTASMLGAMRDPTRPETDGPAARYVWECLDDDCKRREIADHQAEIKRCECGHAMIAVEDVAHGE